ncbi:hypothetical protein BCD67_18390 [Oscillatoriales cyanobacterium USR001]|nr:hypothetical protein BCD67_18390 [Oscillatoriales cyanobacterium USR001]
MNQVAKLIKPNLGESSLRRDLDLKKQIRADATNDLESLTEDFQHMTLVVESIHRNYQALLSENQLLKDTLFSLVDDCDCWEGNRCDRCQQILNALAGKQAQKKANPAREYKEILKQLRKLG